MAAQYVERLTVSIPAIAKFNMKAGMKAISDALHRKNRDRGAIEDLGGASGTGAIPIPIGVPIAAIPNHSELVLTA